MGSNPGLPPGIPTRLPLSPSRRRVSFERRLRVGLWVLLLPSFALGAWLLELYQFSTGNIVLLMLLALGLGAGAISLVMERISHPLQTLSNVVAALREGDYSFRARGARRGDTMGQLALDINALAAMMQAREGSAREAIALLEQVMRAMASPVLAFDPQGGLRLINAAAERALGLRSEVSLGRLAADLGLTRLLHARDDQVISLETRDSAMTRWIVRRSGFRLRGVPHTLLVFSDVSAALREQERLAWRRLIRVMGHEINNSLTPIKSIAGSLHGYLRGGYTEASLQALERGLGVIEDRADSLNRFLQAYAQISGLPAPRFAPVRLPALLERVARVETRLAVSLGPVPVLTVECDADQIEQALINLVKNGAEAALSMPEGEPAVELSARADGGQVTIYVTDNGPGIANGGNLFVPFYTTKPEGTGIGLVLALQILEAHHGTVRLHNRADARGCEAEVVLPVSGDA